MIALVVGLNAWPAPPEARIVDLAAEQLHRAVADVAGDRADAVARVVLRKAGDEPLLVAVDLLVVLHQLLVEHVQQRLTGDVGDVVGTGGGGAAEGASAELALGIAVERDARVLEPEHFVRGLTAHDLDRVLVTEVIRPLDGVERVRFPGIIRVQSCVDAAGRGVRVRPDGMDLGHDRHRRARAGSCESGPLAGQTGTDDQHVMDGHVRTIYGPQAVRDVRYEGARRACSARDTWSIVTTPRRWPSASTAISAPSRRSGSDVISASSGVSVRTWAESAT